MPIRSQLSAIVATQLGRVQGELEARIQDEAAKMTSKFASKCPSQDELVKIAKIRNSLLRIINSFQSLTNRFGRLPKKLRPPIRAANIIIRLLKRSPIPLAVGTPPNKDFGGLISARTAGFVTSQADRLIQVTLLLEALEDDLESVNDLVGNINPNLNNIRSVLDTLNQKIEDCADEAQNSNEEEQNIKNLLNEIQPVESTSIAGSVGGGEEYEAENGRVYLLEVIQEQTSTGPVPRRLAVARDNLGVIILRGQPSFSSDTSVLIEELKFRIDNQLP